MDLPPPLTAAQKHELRWELRRIQRAKDFAEAELSRVYVRVSQLTSRRDRLTAELQLVTSPSVAPCDSAASAEKEAKRGDSAGSQDGGAPEASPDTVPRWKRRREAGECTGPDAHLQPAAHGEQPARSSGLQRGAVFGLVQCFLHDALKDQAQSRELDERRLLAQRKVQASELEEGLKTVSSELLAATHESNRYAHIVGELTPLLESLLSLEERMDEAEDEYCECFFLKAEGSCYNVAFLPAVHTEFSRAVLTDQIMVTAKEYVSGFRADFDNSIRRITESQELLRKLGALLPPGAFEGG